jgi:serine/threonine-protein kinase
MDQTGQTTPLVQERAIYSAPRFSPDGTKLAVAARTATEIELRILDLVRGSINKIRNATYPAWTSDGKFLAARDLTPPGIGIGWYRADGAGERQRIYSSEKNLTTYGFSADGKEVLLTEIAPGKRADLSALPLDLTDREHPKAGTPRALVQSAAGEVFPALSPDGKWLAYASDESGRFESYVTPFSSGSGRWQVSTSGGAAPLWAPNGRALYFLSPDNHIMTAEITPQNDSIAHGQPKQWSPVAIRLSGTNLSYAIHPDGKRFAVFPAAEASPETKGNAHVTFLLNFTDELRRRLSAAK